MKKSRFIKLVLVAATLSSCGNQRSADERKVYLRSDSTANYSQAHYYGGYGGSYGFMPIGMFMAGRYSRSGYYSSSIPPSANFGTNSFKSSVSRSGFGSSSSHGGS